MSLHSLIRTFIKSCDRRKRWLMLLVSLHPKLLKWMALRIRAGVGKEMWWPENNIIPSFKTERYFYFTSSNYPMNLSLEERKLQYIQMIEAEYMPAEKSYWQHPPPTYRFTSDYIIGNSKPIV